MNVRVMCHKNVTASKFGSNKKQAGSNSRSVKRCAGQLLKQQSKVVVTGPYIFYPLQAYRCVNNLAK